MSGVFTAERESLASYIIRDLPGGEDIRIHQAQGLWLPGKRPGDVGFSGRPVSFPQIAMRHKTLTLVRRITRGGFLSTDYEIDFLDEALKPELTAHLPAGQLSSFSLGGEKYEIDLTARFVFRAVLRRGSRTIPRNHKFLVIYRPENICARNADSRRQHGYRLCIFHCCPEGLLKQLRLGQKLSDR